MRIKSYFYVVVAYFSFINYNEQDGKAYGK